MHPFPKHPRIPTSILAALVLPLALGCATASADPVRIRGSVVSLDGAKLVVRSKEGKDVPITLKDKYAALAAVKSSIADIKPGTSELRLKPNPTPRCARSKSWSSPRVFAGPQRAIIPGTSDPTA